jgi:CheY-like chemotaxis protein
LHTLSWRCATNSYCRLLPAAVISELFDAAEQRHRNPSASSRTSPFAKVVILSMPSTTEHLGAPVAAPVLALLDSVGHDALLTAPADSMPSLLLVDDDENNLRALRRVFRREGYRVHTAGSAREGFAILAKAPFGVIVSDQGMPEMSGTEFLTRVKALYPDTIRIILSGYTDIATVTSLVDDGAIYKILTKPWNNDALRRDVCQAFRLHAELRVAVNSNRTKP